MPSLIDIRRRIRSVKNTQQITKAMKMVSAAKLRRAQERVIASRPYAGILENILANVAAVAGSDERVMSHPLLARRAEKKIQIVLLTSDRGLAGAFNTNLIKGTQKLMADHPGAQFSFELIGRKGRDFFRRREMAITGEHLGILNKIQASDAEAIAKSAAELYSTGDSDAVYLIYNEYKSVVSQKVLVKKLLPIVLPEEAATTDYIYEEPPGQLLGSLLPKYVENAIFSGMLETSASEHAARMTAMDAASTNAAEVIDKLTLYMNRVRQASITKEIIEVVSGAAALE
ncbi:MAG: ATP synthase F1 subunit gamma [Acidobacteria bacterium]|nr:ATP synthase F1 subunit gamma [Acidobacteriota bacterium]